MFLETASVREEKPQLGKVLHKVPKLSTASPDEAFEKLEWNNIRNRMDGDTLTNLGLQMI